MPVAHIFKDEWLAVDLLVERAVDYALIEALRREREPYLAEALIRSGAMDYGSLGAIIERVHKLGYLDSPDIEISPLAVNLVPLELCGEKLFVPMQVTGNAIRIAAADPFDIHTLDKLQELSARVPFPYYCLPSLVQKIIARNYATAAQHAPLAAHGRAAEPAGLPPRILVADDDPVARAILKAYLRSNGFAVQEAKDGREAMSRIACSPPDLLISDLRMPNLDGLGVIKAVQSMRLLERMPIVILTAVSDEESQRRTLDLGADDYVIKPFNHRIVLSRVNAVLRRSKFAVRRAV